MIREFAVLVLVMVVSGCNKAPYPVYQLISSENGQIYRMNTTTGVVAEVKGGRLVQLPDVTFVPLVVGQAYALEDGQEVKYMGAGKFETLHRATIKWEQLKNP